jgi:hypothetical protein
LIGCIDLDGVTDVEFNNLMLQTGMSQIQVDGAIAAGCKNVESVLNYHLPNLINVIFLFLFSLFFWFVTQCV